MLPVTSFVEEEGTLTNSSRAIAWKWQAADPYVESRTDNEILADLFLRIRQLYEKEGGKGVEPLLAIDWSYADPLDPTADELLKELNGKALADLTDAEGKVTRRPASSSPASARCATTARPTASSGSTPASTGRTATSRSGGTTRTRRASASTAAGASPGRPTAAFSTTVPRPTRRASPGARPRSTSYWDGARGPAPTCRTSSPTNPPERGTGPFIMNPEGRLAPVRPDMMADGPFPAHYEPFESPVANPLFPKVRGNPVARVFDGDMEIFGNAKDFPIVATTYRLIEHFHYWTKNVHINAVMQPEFFVELSEELAAGEGHQNGAAGPDLVAPRLGQGKGGRDQAAEAAADRRQDRAHRRTAAALRLHRRGPRRPRRSTR